MALKRTTRTDAAFSMSSMTDIVFLLAPALQELIGSEEDPTFSIYTDEKTPVGEVVAVMNVGKKLDYKVILATRPE